MNVHEGIDGLKRVPAGAVMSIGNFDGLHLGHAKILEVARSLRDRSPGAHLAVVTFEPHPLTVLRPQLAPPRLTPYPQKQELLELAGVDDLVVLPPSPDVLNLAAEQFWAILRDEVRPSHLVEGTSFNFGKNRGGTIDKLREWTAVGSIQLHVVDAVQLPLLDLSVVEVNSSLIRWLVSYGRVRDAAICLGRPYQLQGAVIRGYGRGRQIGVPTANIDCKDVLIPADGVYAARCNLNGVSYAAAVSIGTMPTFGEHQRQIESHLIDFSGDLYDQIIQVDLIDWLRDQVRFPDIQQLKEQLAQDFSEAGRRAKIHPERAIARLVPA